MKLWLSPVMLMAVGVLASSMLAGTSLNIEFTQDEGYLMLEGQNGWSTSQELVELADQRHYPSGVVNLHNPGVDRQPGVIEILNYEENSGARRNLDEPVTGDLTFHVWFNKYGNTPDDPPSGPDDIFRAGNSGLTIFLGEPATSQGATSGNKANKFAFVISTRALLQGRVISYSKDCISCGRSFFDRYGIFPATRPIPDPPYAFPPHEGWWGIRADVRWDPNAGENGRYTSWDFYYQHEDDTDWSLVEAGLNFHSHDDEGFDGEISAIHTYSRPSESNFDMGYGPKRILMDDLFLGPLDGGPAFYEAKFGEEEGFLMLEGQNGWVNPGPGGPTATVLARECSECTFNPGMEGSRRPDPWAPGPVQAQDGLTALGVLQIRAATWVELIGAEDSFPSRPFDTRMGDTTFIGWFNRGGTVEDIYDSDDENFDPDRPGFSGLEVSLGNDSYDLDDAAVYITTRDTEHAIQYQKGSDGEMGVGPTPPDMGWWGVRADLHWDESTGENGRYTSWDFYYRLEEEDWTLIEEGLGFRSEDDHGYDHDFNALMTWNRPCVECGDSDGFGQNRIWMDGIFVGDLIGGMPIAGDIDGDGDVDFTDFSILSGNFTGTLEPGMGGKTPEAGDIDGDGDVDFTDFSMLAGNFTGTLAASSGARGSNLYIPEPMSLLLVGPATVLLIGRRRCA